MVTKKFKGHKIIKKDGITIIRDEVEDILIKGKVLDIKPKKLTKTIKKAIPTIYNIKVK